MALAAQRGLPLPPQPVMPPEGVAPVTQQIDTTGQDLQSPTTMIQNYLAARGYQPTPENVSRALAANASDPGVISGLRSDTPGTNPVGPVGGSGVRVPAGRTPLNEINTSVMPGDRPPGTGDAPVGGSGGGLLTALGVIAPQIASWILGRRTPPAAPMGQPATQADAIADASRPGGNPAPEPVKAPVSSALDKATDGAEVRGVKPVDPNVVSGRAQGPTTSVEGEPVPEMPPTSSKRPPEAVRTEPGRAPLYTPRTRARLHLR